MPEPDILQQQRQLLRAFRKVGVQRATAEAGSEVQSKTERLAADQVHASVQAAAEAAWATAETGAQILRETELTNADAELKQARQTIYRYMGEVSKVEEQARAALEGGGWLSLVEDIRAVKPAIDTSLHAGQELASAAHDVAQAGKLISGLVAALAEAQQRTRHRQEKMGIAILVSAIVVVVIGLALYGSWQNSQQTRRYQATATVEAAIVQGTATAEAAVLGATATANAIVAQATATAVVSWLTSYEEQTGAKMVFVPAGDFIMGRNFVVHLDAFLIDQMEVSERQYQLCVDAGVCQPPFNVTNRLSSAAPVTKVAWDQARTYCQWRGARLPTEAEWEKAARGTDGRTYPWGEGIDCTLANYAGVFGNMCSTDSTGGVSKASAVGSYPNGASPYGVLNMSGNVEEWTDDSSEGLLEPNALIPVRGGKHTNYASDVTTTSRRLQRPTISNKNYWELDHVGFRCAASP